MLANELYRIARWAYSIGEPIISDAEYDVLQMSIRPRNIAEIEDTYSMEDCPVELLKKHGYDYLIKTITLSGEKSLSIVSIKDAAEAKLYYAARDHRNYLLSYKMDGWNMQVHYLDGVLADMHTRGRKADVIDCVAFKPHIPQNVKEKGHQRIYGELCLDRDNFEKLKKMYPSKGYTSQRAAVRGALINAPELLTYYAFDMDDDYLDVYDKFQVLQRLGFNVPPHVVCHSTDVVATVEKMSAERDNNLSSDGVVAFGLGNTYERDARALRLFSWENPVHIADIVGYSESYGRHYISVKLKINPVQTMFGKQTEIDIDNTDRIQKYGLHVGKKVVFEVVSHANANICVELTKLINEEGVLPSELRLR